MTNQQFVEKCSRVCRDAQNQLPLALRTRLKTDTERRKDKDPDVMLFSIRDKERSGLWNGYYTTYALVHNPFKGVGGIWHCRFMHHKKRKDTGSGRFNDGIDRLVRRYNGQGGFHLEQNDEVFNLTQPFKGTEPQLESKLAHALAFLVAHLHPGLDKVIAGTEKLAAKHNEGKQGDSTPKKTSENVLGRTRRYWVVSPNVKDDDSTVEAWCAASIREQGAFMGWAPDDWEHGAIGPKFAGLAEPGILPGDVILLARRYNHKPHLVGFGVVRGNPLTSLKNFAPPQDQPFGSFRRLSPFVPWSRVPLGVPLKETLRWTKAMAELHPTEEETHKKVCDWMERHLRSAEASHPISVPDQGHIKHPTLIDPPEAHQLDFVVQTREQVINAKATEAGLLASYREWLKKQDRQLVAARYGKLWCDGYEVETKNLVEAKSSTQREYVRMAVGQLLDYAFMGKKHFGEPNKAILLPAKPEAEVLEWLRSLDISVIWQERGLFFDNADRWFT